MMKCPKDKSDAAVHRAKVMVCPKCGVILDAEELLRMLKRLGISKRLVEGVQSEIDSKKLVKLL